MRYIVVKVINPDLSTYLFKFIPRTYDLDDAEVLTDNTGNQLEDENALSLVASDNVLSYCIVNELTGEQIINFFNYSFNTLGYLEFNLDVTLLQGYQNYSIKIFDYSGIVYRGKIYLTNETDLQNYSLITVNENIIDL